MQKENKPKVLILVVAYNAENTIKKLLDRIPKETLEVTSEILIADDSSQDKTSELALEYKNQHKMNKIQVVRHEKNKGYGGNQKWGYNYAIKNNFDVVVMIHGDSQYPPEQINELIKPIEEGKADFMFGSRITGDPLGGGMPLYKFVANRFLTILENFVLRTKLTEFHSGFRAYNVHTLAELPLHEDYDGYHFDSEIIMQLAIAKKSIGEITIPTYYGDEKCHVPGVRYGLSILRLLSQYLLHKSYIKHYSKYEINTH